MSNRTRRGVDRERAKPLLDVPEGYRTDSVLALGYLAEVPSRPRLDSDASEDYNGDIETDAFSPSGSKEEP